MNSPINPFFKSCTVVGVAGASGSGKSTIVKNIMEEMDTDTYVVLDNDSYYKDFAELSLEERAKQNFDHPNTLDQCLFLEHLRALKENQPIEKPVYDFVHHRRTAKTVMVSPKKIIIVEGILVLENRALRNEMDIKLFVDTDPDICLIRRIERDMKERGRQLTQILEQYEQNVKPMFLEFVEPSKRYADVIIPHGGRNKVAIDMVVNKLRSLSSPSPSPVIC